MEDRPVTEPGQPLHADTVYLERISRDMREITLQLREVLRYIKEAESEIPEKIRRFMNYFHDAHDVIYAYEERGIPVPQHILREMERLDDRYRQILEELHAPGAAFEKVRRDMAADPENRWDHTKALEFKGRSAKL